MTMRYQIIGNFQYDLAIFGLKRVLDLLQMPYHTDNAFYIEIDLTPEQTVEKIALAKVHSWNASDIFSNIFDKIKKGSAISISKEEESQLRNQVETALSQNINHHTIDQYVQNTAKICTRYFATVFSDISNLQDLIEEIIWNRINFETFNNVLLNFAPNSGGRKGYESALRKLRKDIEEGNPVCSFCNQHPGKPIARDLFFFAPAQFNAYWRLEPSFHICAHCLAAVFAIPFALHFPFQRNRGYVFYVPHLESLDDLYKILEKKFERKLSLPHALSQTVIEYENIQKTQIEALQPIQYLEIVFSSQNPDLELYHITQSAIDTLLDVEEQLNQIFENYKKTSWGKVKAQKGYVNIDLGKKLFDTLIDNQDLFQFVLRYIPMVISAEMARVDNKSTPLFQGFFPIFFLKVLEMYFKIKGSNAMNQFESFKYYGRQLQSRVRSQMEESGQQVDPNTLNNKLISLAMALMNASRGTLDQFMETLTRIIIQYDAPIHYSQLKDITQESYRSIAATIALALMSGDRKSSTQQEIVQ